jgi:hypothetical protein
MRGVERVGSLRAHIEHQRKRRRPVACQALQALPFQQLHGDERLAGVFTDVVDHADIRMIE